MNIPKIQNMQSSNGNDVPNQFIITMSNGARLFQSYNSIIARKDKAGIMLDINKWDYSVTTGKYRNQFLGEGIADTRKKIKSGVYKLTNLNK